MNVIYPILEGKIAERGILKRDIAKRLNLSTQAMTTKLRGKRSFTWPEALAIHDEYFPDVSIEKLFERNDHQEVR